MSLVDLQESAKAGKLVIVCGAGISIALADPARPAPGWPQLIERGLGYGQLKGVIDKSQLNRWRDAAASTDMDDLLAAAQFVFRKLGGRDGLLYARWLEQEFAALSPRAGEMKDAITLLSERSQPICTVNYDTLLEQASGRPSLSFKDARAVMGWARRENNGILHLHGTWSDPSSCVLGVSDYDDATNDEFRDTLQRSLSSFNRLLFVGCGETLKDPNISNLIYWMKKHVGSAALQHFALLRDRELSAFHQDELYQGFVEPLSYGDDFDQLPSFLSSIVGTTPVRKRRHQDTDASPVLEAYRQYIIRDCGQMTIEGVRADADTAKQKFDIEKLFVPLAVDGVPPEIPQSDPQREEKIRQWEEDKGARIPFGDALRGNKRLALLALPGGGKTLLLKRLAVAYADRERRTTTNDRLPKVDLLPILIRCREWRDHIRLPISSIVDRIGEITGLSEINGLYEAAKQRFTAGSILLLVDGLDEIHNDADRTIFVEHLEEFLTKYPKIRLVVTSREAGFSLVAPNIMRFSSRWRIAPLDRDAIRLLCGHWHKLMLGDCTEAREDARTVSETLLANDALTRLAENPLLLTMLLVVKHGYGRLPPDRVSLYERAVEVLLDTWNIKGHEALNPKEAVPQLAYVALRLMREGKQTATERELLSLLEDGRQRVSIVRLYAKDSPQDFLKRVELRSSLLLEAGRVVEDGRTVPFYQFRHLTFQEYLAAVAAVEGHYDDYKQGDSPLVPLSTGLVAEDWKEVVPMAAVLARKQAEPLLKALVDASMEEERVALATQFSSEEFEWSSNYRMPAPVSRLAQCLVEEAEFSQASLNDAIRLVATFAHGCQKSENWKALARGPFGEALNEEAWLLYTKKGMPGRSWLRNTVALLHGYRAGGDRSTIDTMTENLERQLESGTIDEVGRAAATICGLIWLKGADIARLAPLISRLERGLDLRHPEIFQLTAWAISRLHGPTAIVNAGAKVADKSLDALVSYWDDERRVVVDGPQIGDFSLSKILLFRKNTWRPKLSVAAEDRIRLNLKAERALGSAVAQRFDAAVLLAYHAGMDIDEETIVKLQKHSRRGAKGAITLILEALGRGVPPAKGIARPRPAAH